MLKSMTAFGRARSLSSDASLDITAEIKSVNSRYLDVTVKLPRMYSFLEDRVRTFVSEKGITRGKVEVYIGVDVLVQKGLEIDIVESINNEDGLCNHALHWSYRDLHSVTSGQMKKEYIYDGKFHTFAVDRSENGYVFYIDGAETWRAGPEMCEPCPEKGYMKVTMEAAGWAGAGTEASRKALPADMVVDYVRVYSKKP